MARPVGMISKQRGGGLRIDGWGWGCRRPLGKVRQGDRQTDGRERGWDAKQTLFRQTVPVDFLQVFFDYL